jgi:hypothetical protein
MNIMKPKLDDDDDDDDDDSPSVLRKKILKLYL